MFNYPATEIFRPSGERRVVWSIEEYNLAIAEGYSEDRPVEPVSDPPKDSAPVKRGPGRPKKGGDEVADE